MLISETLSRMNQNSSKINKLLKTVCNEVSELSAAFNRMQQANTQQRIAQLHKENEDLEKQIEKYKTELSKLRTANGVPEILVPKKVNTSACASEPTPPSEKPSAPVVAPKRDVKPAAPKKENKKAAPEAESEEEIHFGRLDIRVGKIISVEKHPNADSLYVEQVDVGDDKPKTVLSGLVRFVTIEEMKDRIALFLCNLKPVKMRGISSEGMIMCTSDGEKCEILQPPAGCKPGEVVTVEGCERKPDPQLNPKKKVFETVQVDLKINDKKEATYKGLPWIVGGKGPAVSKSLTNTIIK